MGKVASVVRTGYVFRSNCIVPAGEETGGVSVGYVPIKIRT